MAHLNPQEKSLPLAQQRVCKLRGAAAERLHLFKGGQTAHLNPQEKSLPAQAVATAALLQAVWSRCGAFTPSKAAKRHT